MRISAYFYLLRSFLGLVLRLHTLSLMVLAALSIWLCDYYGWASDKWPSSILATTIIFPVTFGIGYSYSRRERVLVDLADLKATLICLFQLYREWTSAFKKRPDRPPRADYAEEYCLIVSEFIYYLSRWLNHRASKTSLYPIYKCMDRLSQLNELIRCEDEWVKSLLSRLYQYQRFVLVDLERLRVVHDFRTVSTLRGYGFVFLILFPILMAPNFAYLNHIEAFASPIVEATNASNSSSSGELPGPPTYLGYIVSMLICLMLSTLQQIQDDLEDPFDEIGKDDINVYLLSEVSLHFFKADLVEEELTQA